MSLRSCGFDGDMGLDNRVSQIDNSPMSFRDISFSRMQTTFPIRWCIQSQSQVKKMFISANTTYA